MPDPVARAIGQLLDHVQAVEERLEGMCGALKALGSDYCAKELPELREEDFVEVKPDAGEAAAEVRVLAVAGIMRPALPSACTIRVSR